MLGQNVWQCLLRSRCRALHASHLPYAVPSLMHLQLARSASAPIEPSMHVYCHGRVDSRTGAAAGLAASEHLFILQALETAQLPPCRSTLYTT